MKYQDFEFDSLKEIAKLALKLDQIFFRGAVGSKTSKGSKVGGGHRVHGVYYQPNCENKFVSIACRLKNCNFRVNFTFEKDANGRPTRLKFAKVNRGSHAISSHNEGHLKDVHEASRYEYR